MNLPPAGSHHQHSVFVAGGPHGSQIFLRNLDQETENMSTITNASDTPARDYNIDEAEFPGTSLGSAQNPAQSVKNTSKSTIHHLFPDLTFVRPMFSKIL